MKLVGSKYNNIELHKLGIDRTQTYTYPLKPVLEQAVSVERVKYNEGMPLFNITITLTERGQNVIDTLRRLICAEFNITQEELKSDERYMPLSKARGAFTSILRSSFNFPLKLVGTYLGGRDHSSILMAERRAKEFYKKNDTYRSAYDNVEKSFIKFLGENKYSAEHNDNNGFNDFRFA